MQDEADFQEPTDGGRPPADQRADEEYALLRRERFGRLPGRIPPAELVELVDPDPDRERHEPGEPRREWG